MMKQLSIVLFSMLFSASIYGQEIDWSASKNWKLYQTKEDRALHYSIDTLKNLPWISLSVDTTLSFLKQAVAWPKEKYSLWMGVFVATCELPDNKLRKVDLSVYGGFFYDEVTQRYYEIPKNLQRDWQEFLGESYDRITQ